MACDDALAEARQTVIDTAREYVGFAVVAKAAGFGGQGYKEAREALIAAVGRLGYLESKRQREV